MRGQYDPPVKHLRHSAQFQTGFKTGRRGRLLGTGARLPGRNQRFCASGCMTFGLGGG